MPDNFGFKIGVEGEKEFKSALQDIRQTFKVLGSEMNLVEMSSPQAPTAVIGTQRVASLLPRYRSGNDSFFYLVGFGKSGSAAGVYVNGVKQFVVHVK